MRKILDEKDPSGATERERIFRHQVEAAQAWEVRIVGKDGNGELLKVASARDSTAAAEFVFGLIGIKPLDVDKNRLAFADHLRAVARDHVEIGRQLIGKQAETWTPEQIRQFWDVCERDPSRFLRMAEDAMAAAEPITVDAQPSQPAIAAPGEAGSAERTDYGRGAEPVASTLQSARGDNSAPNADATVGTTPSTASNSTLDEDGE